MGSAVRVVLCLSLTVAMCAPRTSAQAPDPEPIGRFAVDVRGALPRYPEDPETATALGVTVDNLPGRGLGLAAGVNVYPARLGKHVALGVGAEWLMFSRGRKTLDPATEGGPSGPTVTTRFSVLSPQVSLNFGGRDGWSYVSGGMGWAAFTTERDDAPVAEADGNTGSYNYGGGARWFPQEHLAFAFDLRFYRLDPQDAATGRPAYGGRKIMTFSVGISVK